MPIPAFDNILNALPPHVGDPRQSNQLSPYDCSVEELCDRFATSQRRKEILQGHLQLRNEQRSLGIEGFQWLDGSLCEDIEASEGRDPGDIDVVTFVEAPASPVDLHTVVVPNRLFDRADLKARFSVDHFYVSLGSKPSLLVNVARYWYGLFSHRRDRMWKGMLRVLLSADPADDGRAVAVLGGKP